MSGNEDLASNDNFDFCDKSWLAEDQFKSKKDDGGEQEGQAPVAGKAATRSPAFALSPHLQALFLNASSDLLFWGSSHCQIFSAI